MKLAEITDSLSESKDSQLKKTSDDFMQSVIREALKEIRQKLDEIDEGRLSVPVLGTFIVKKGVRNIDGKEVSVQRITLRSPKVKSKKT